MAEILTPTEIAKRLGVTALAFRKWLREQKAEGHPLVASHEYRARYRFTRAEADQLAAEFAEQVRGAGGTGVAPKAPSTRTSRAGPPTEGATRADSQVEHPRSRDPGHRVTAKWMREEVETLADLLRDGLRAVAVGINPAPKSVAAGHYYQGNYGQTLFPPAAQGWPATRRRGLRRRPQLRRWHRFHRCRQARHARQAGPPARRARDGRKILEAKLTTLDVPLVIFVFKSAAETLLGPLPAHFYGLVPHRRLGEARVFIMPGPTVARATEADAIKKLKRALRAAT